MGKDSIGQDPESLKLYRSSEDGLQEVLLGTIVSIRNGSVQGAAQEATTSTAYVNFASPDIQVSLTTLGGPVWVHFQTAFQVSGGQAANAVLFVRLLVDGVAEPGAEMGHRVGAANLESNLVLVWMKSGLAPGTHLFRIQWRVSNATVTALSNRRQMSCTELQQL